MIASTIALFALPFTLLVQGIPTPDVSPPGVKPDECIPPSCDLFCRRLTLHTLSIQGQENSAFSASQSMTVTYDGVDVCPRQQQDCYDGCSHTYTCNEGWSFTVPEGPMQGPKPYDLQGLPAERVLGSSGTTLPPLGEITMDEISCDVYQCGGGSIPINCRNCAIAYTRYFYTWDDIPDCTL